MASRSLAAAALLSLIGGCRHLGDMPSPHEPAGDYAPDVLPDVGFDAQLPVAQRAIRLTASELERLDVDAVTLGFTQALHDRPIEKDIAKLGGTHFLAVVRGVDGRSRPTPEATSVCGRYSSAGRVPCGPWQPNGNDDARFEAASRRLEERDTYLVLRVAPERWGDLAAALRPTPRTGE